MAATIDIPAGGYRYIPFAFQYSGGVAALRRLPDRAGRVRAAVAARRRLRLDRALSGRAGRAAGRRSAPASCGRRRSSPTRASSNSTAHYTGTLHALGRDEEPGTTIRWRAATSSRRCTSRPNPASTRSASRVRPRARQAPSSSPAAARLATDPRRTRAHGPIRRDQPRRHAREGGVRAGPDGGAHGGAGQDLGRHHGDAGVHGARPARPHGRRDRPRAARRGMGWSGTSRVRRLKAWSTRWTAAAFRWSTTFVV